MTIYRLRWCEFYFISTHILTKRMTLDIFRKWTGHSISTHILTKRMTCTFSSSNSSGLSFQLTSSRRGWPGQLDSPQFVQTFQLTSSRRGWPVSLILHHAHTIFQLTSSRRGWHWPDTNTFRTGISTHILTKRMTWRYKRASDHRSISTHILTKRMTITPLMKSRIDVFQLTSSRRGWLCVDTICSRIA